MIAAKNPHAYSRLLKLYGLTSTSTGRANARLDLRFASGRRAGYFNVGPLATWTPLVALLKSDANAANAFGGAASAAAACFALLVSAELERVLEV